MMQAAACEASASLNTGGFGAPPTHEHLELIHLWESFGRARSAGANNGKGY
jgi:hypothetical protein